MKRPKLATIFPHWTNAALALLAAMMLVLAFPDYDLWWMAWIALVPLMFAVEREKASVLRSFVTGWIFGTAFFFGTCWWLAYAPIHYAGFPPVLAYSLIFIATLGAGLFPALFTAVLGVLMRRFGTRAYLAAPFVWVFSEFLRYWLTGNNWNAIGYSQAFVEIFPFSAVWTAAIGGVLATGFVIVLVNLIVCRIFEALFYTRPVFKWRLAELAMFTVVWIGAFISYTASIQFKGKESPANVVVAVQPNVPMSGLDQRKLEGLRDRQIELAEIELSKMPTDHRLPTTVILPESPMNFMYNDDREFQKFIGDFARRNNISVLFNSAEPDPTNGKYFNSAVMVGTDGSEVSQYDKIYLLPFGEAVPIPFDGLVPAFVGSFSYGREYDLLPVGDAKAGVMICFESHFGQLSRRYVQDGADVIIEMTNDGYLGPTPVLRQHLANAVFRAAETNRPVLRVTNVGITERIHPGGNICDSLTSCGPAPYTEGSAVWRVSKSDGSQTFYVKYGDWFAWLSTIITMLLLMWSLKRQPIKSVPGTEWPAKSVSQQSDGQVSTGNEVTGRQSPSQYRERSDRPM